MGAFGATNEHMALSVASQLLIRELHRLCEITGSKPRWSPDFFRLLNAIAKIAFPPARIIACKAFDDWEVLFTSNERRDALDNRA